MPATEQLELLPLPPPPPTLEERWRAFRREHPEVMRRFIAEALRLRRAGQERGGAKMIWERLRWLHAIEGGKDYKLNNSYTALAARDAMRECDELAGFFETRERR